MRYKNDWDKRMDEIRKEEFQVVVRLKESNNMLRLTYSHLIGESKIIEMEELNHNEEVLCSCKFYGRSYKGNGCSWMLPIKRGLTFMKIKDWVINRDLFVEEYYKKH